MLVGSKADAAPPGAADSFHAWAAELFPPKSAVLTTQHGQLDPQLLDQRRGGGTAALISLRAGARRAAQQQRRVQALLSTSDGSAEAGEHSQGGEQGASSLPAAASPSSAAAPQPASARPGAPLRIMPQAVQQQQQQQHSACGWVFDEGDVFDRQRLLALLQQLERRVARVKGVFRLGPSEWVMPVSSQLDPATAPATAPSSNAASGLAEGAPGSSAAAPGAANDLVAASSSGVGAAAGLLALRPVCYRGASMAEVILHAGSSGTSANAQSSSSEPAIPVGEQLAAAVCSAGEGDWGPLEAEWLLTLRSTAATAVKS